MADLPLSTPVYEIRSSNLHQEERREMKPRKIGRGRGFAGFIGSHFCQILGVNFWRLECMPESWNIMYRPGRKWSWVLPGHLFTMVGWPGYNVWFLRYKWNTLQGSTRVFYTKYNPAIPWGDLEWFPPPGIYDCVKSPPVKIVQNLWLASNQQIMAKVMDLPPMIRLYHMTNYDFVCHNYVTIMIVI